MNLNVYRATADGPVLFGTTTAEYGWIYSKSSEGRWGRMPAAEGIEVLREFDRSELRWPGREYILFRVKNDAVLLGDGQNPSLLPGWVAV